MAKMTKKLISTLIALAFLMECTGVDCLFSETCADRGALRPMAAAKSKPEANLLGADVSKLELLRGSLSRKKEEYGAELVDPVASYLKDENLSLILKDSDNLRDIAANLINNFLRAEGDVFEAWESLGIFSRDIDMFGKIKGRVVTDEVVAAIAHSLIKAVGILPDEIPRDNIHIQKLIKGKNPLSKLLLFREVYGYLENKVGAFPKEDINILVTAVHQISLKLSRLENAKKLIGILDGEIQDIKSQSIGVKKQYLIAVYETASIGEELARTLLNNVISTLKDAGITFDKLETDDLKKQYLIAVYNIVKRGKAAAKTLGDIVIPALRDEGITFDKLETDELKKQYLIAIYWVAKKGKDFAEALKDIIIPALRDEGITFDKLETDELKKYYLAVIYLIAERGKEFAETLGDIAIPALRDEGITFDKLETDELKKQYLIAIYKVAMAGKESAKSLKDIVIPALSSIPLKENLSYWLRIIWRLVVLKKDKAYISQVVNICTTIEPSQLSDWLGDLIELLDKEIFTPPEKRKRKPSFPPGAIPVPMPNSTTVQLINAAA